MAHLDGARISKAISRKADGHGKIHGEIAQWLELLGFLSQLGSREGVLPFSYRRPEMIQVLLEAEVKNRSHNPSSLYHCGSELT